MNAQLVFDPAKITSLQCPFTLIIKQTSGKDIKYQHEPYLEKNLKSIYSKDYDQNTLKILSSLTAGELKKEEKKYASHYRQLNPKKNLVD